MNKKYQVFISSTYEDLKVERSEVTKSILELDCIPSGMEAFCSESEEQFEIIKRIIDLCDYYVLIIANRYGSINKKENKSYTELEYEYACSKNIPVLAFLVANDSEKPHDDQLDKLNVFKERVSSNRMITTWHNKDDLAKNVVIALSNAFKKNDRSGWVKYDESQKELSIVKELQNKNEALLSEIQHAKETINNLSDELKTLTSIDEKLIYDQKPIEIKYAGYSTEIVKQVSLKELFGKVSIHLINVSLREDMLMELIAKSIDQAYYQKIKDTDLKRICNQFLALNLFSSRWNDENSALFYSLTKKEKKERDLLNLYTL